MEEKRINIQVKVTYTVNMDCDVTEEMYDALEHYIDEYPCGINEEYIQNDEIGSNAYVFLSEICKEDDAFNCEIDIEEITEIF